MNTGKPSEAEAEYRKGLAIYQKLADDNPAVTEFRSEPGRRATTTSAFCCGTRASRRRRRPSSASALALVQKLADDNPAVTEFRSQPGAEPLRPRPRVVGHGQASRGGGRVPQVAVDPAEAGRRQPRRHLFRFSLALSHFYLGDLLSKTGKPAEAEAEFRKAMAIYQKLADDDPAVTDYRNDLAWSHRALANLLSKTGKPAEAEAEYRKAVAIRQKLVDDNPADTGFRSSLADSHFDHGILLSNTGKPAEAEAEYRKALAIRQKLADDNPADTGFRSSLADSHFNLGDPAVEDGQASGGGGRVPQGAGDPAEAGRRQPL